MYAVLLEDTTLIYVRETPGLSFNEIYSFENSDFKRKLAKAITKKGVLIGQEFYRVVPVIVCEGTVKE
jgi:hypothetical protein